MGSRTVIIPLALTIVAGVAFVGCAVWLIHAIRQEGQLSSDKHVAAPHSAPPSVGLPPATTSVRPGSHSEPLPPYPPPYAKPKYTRSEADELRTALRAIERILNEKALAAVAEAEKFTERWRSSAEHDSSFFDNAKTLDRLQTLSMKFNEIDTEIAAVRKTLSPDRTDLDQIVTLAKADLDNELREYIRFVKAFPPEQKATAEMIRAQGPFHANLSLAIAAYGRRIADTLRLIEAERQEIRRSQE